MTGTLTAIQVRYDAENDCIPGGPRVTWAEKALADYCEKLEDRIRRLEHKSSGLLIFEVLLPDTTTEQLEVYDLSDGGYVPQIGSQIHFENDDTEYTIKHVSAVLNSSGISEITVILEGR